ncbi:MAG: glycosyltransferase family 4 protein [Planctomycetes bacterium]|nr:glycosyltransferase family 4 protein [Planctomycetota bacterium]
MKIAYATELDLTYPGVGRDIARNAILGLHESGCLEKLYLYERFGLELPDDVVETFPRILVLGSLIKRAMRVFGKEYYGDWYRFAELDRRISKTLEPCDIFHVWEDIAIYSSRRAKELGATVVIDRPLAHADSISEVLAGEMKKLGVEDETMDPAWIDSRRKRGFGLADYIHVPSDYAAQTFIDRGFAPEQMIVQSFGVDLDLFTPPEEQDYGGTFKLLFVGRVGIRKGIHVLLEAWDRLRLKDAELMILGKVFGDGEKIRDKYAGTPNVNYLGYGDTPAVYRSASAFCLPSFAEGSALVTYEAMASGLPVIVTDACGAVARDGMDGYVVGTGDVDALCERIKTLYDDRDLLARQSRSARQRVEEYPWSRYALGLLAHYRRILGKG